MTHADSLILVPILPAPEPAMRTMRVVVADDGAIVLEARTSGREARCPVCHQLSTRVQSRYRRTLADLAAQGVPVRMRVEVRRFRCATHGCARRIFTERLAPFATPYARRTTRLTTALTRIGMLTGGEVGARLLPALGLSASSTTLLRLVHRAVVPVAPTPRVLGVDDWARRRGQTYGTILVDLERRVPVDLLDDRTAETLSTWLQAHPGVEIISRDRAGAYALGARAGAPDAVQVADRWHLLKNVGEVLERVLHQHRRAIDDALPREDCEFAEATTTAAPGVTAADAVADTANPAVLLTGPTTRSSSVETSSAEVAVEGPRTAREVAFEQVHALHATGLSIRAVTKRLGLSRITVRKYLRAEQFPERTGRRGPSPSLSRWEGHLRSRWAEGCTNARVLWEELQAQGFRGSKRALREYVCGWRTNSPAAKGATSPARPGLQRPSSQQVRWWLTLPEQELKPEQRTFVTRLVETCPAVREGQRLTRSFTDLFETRDAAQLVPWLEDAEASAMASFRDFAIGLRRDFEAVRAALTSPWSNGQTEGQVTKVKLLKRQGYGRASLHLLRQRLLCSA
jgi:transposase